MCSDCKRNINNGGNCSGNSEGCFLNVNKDLPDNNPVVFSKSLKYLKRVENPLQRNFNS